MLLAYFCLDPSLGKIEKSSLPQQTLMDLFIDGNEEMDWVWGDRESIFELKDWIGLRFDESGTVKSIDWNGFHLDGSLRWEWLPSSIRTFGANNCAVAGTIDLTVLPECMCILELQDNMLSGNIGLTSLPSQLEYLDLSRNSLTGSINLEMLPDTLSSLNLSRNELDGTVSLSQLPKYMRYLALHNNQFCGPLDLKNLPDSLEKLSVASNPLTGTFDLRVPTQLYQLDVSSTKLSGKMQSVEGLYITTANSGVTIIY
mmetsp:Transcript_4632/g.6966  ORF Transcript_4632/g.6966 Transcript_4632/m.6966 type:complete len:257 (-) Transcript_4632:34-804(-)